MIIFDILGTLPVINPADIEACSIGNGEVEGENGDIINELSMISRIKRRTRSKLIQNTTDKRRFLCMFMEYFVSTLFNV